MAVLAGLPFSIFVVSTRAYATRTRARAHVVHIFVHARQTTRGGQMKESAHLARLIVGILRYTHTPTDLVLQLAHTYLYGRDVI